MVADRFPFGAADNRLLPYSPLKLSTGFTNAAL